jgi:PGF-CTERM protein
MVAPATIGTTVAQDEWPDQCNNANEVSVGTYSGSLSPKDVDTLVVNNPPDGSVFIKLDTESQTTITFMNQSVVQSLFASGTMNEFLQDVNSPKAGLNKGHYLYEDYSLVGDFAKFNMKYPKNRNPYLRMGWGPNDRPEYLLSFEPTSEAWKNTPNTRTTPFFGPLWYTNEGSSTGMLYFESGGKLCIRIQTSSIENAGSWELTIREEKSTPTATATTISNETSGQGQQTEADTTENTDNGVQDTDGDGVIDSEDYAPRDPEVQEKSDLQNTSGGSTPGFGISTVILAIVAATVVVTRRL